MRAFLSRQELRTNCICYNILKYLVKLLDASDLFLNPTIATMLVLIIVIAKYLYLKHIECIIINMKYNYFLINLILMDLFVSLDMANDYSGLILSIKMRSNN